MKKFTNYLITLALTAFTLTSCEDVPSPFGEIVKPDSGDVIVVEPSGSGTEADPYNVAGVLEYISGLGADVQSTNEVYIKGIITEVQEIDVTGTYGNATYYISDDADGKANKFYIYRGFGLGGKKFNEGATAIKASDNVVIKSKVVNYKGNTPETVANNCIIVELNGTKDSGSSSGGEDTPTSDLGTKDAPITVAKALEAINKLADNGETAEAYVKGIISKVQSYSDQYKSITYYISDDGQAANELQIYSGKNVGAADFSSMDELAAGDVVVVKGKLKKYVNSKTGAITLEMNQPNEIITITKGSGGGGGTDTPSGTMTKSVSGTAVTLTSSSVTGSDEVTVDFNAQGWADKATPTTVTLSNGTTIEFGAGENTSNSPAFYAATKGVRVYAKNTITVKGSKSIAKIVMNCDSYNGTDYVGNEMLYAKEEGQTVTICNDHTEAKGGTQLRIQTMVITFEGEGTDGGGGDTPSGATSLDADFKANGQGDWTIANVKALPDGVSYIWSYDSKYGMKASAYVSGKRYETDNWLVSPTLNLASGGTMTFKQALNYATSDYVKIMYTTTNGTGDVKSSEWKEATVDTWPAGSDWNFIESKATLPAGTVRVAFRYTSDTSKAATWEIESLSIK